MKKFFILLTLLAVYLPVKADDFENAIKSNENVVLYLYTKDCISCQNFTPKFNQVLKKHPEVKGVMVDANTKYGRKLIFKYKGRYIPYLVLANSKKYTTISTYCFTDSICLERALKEIKN